MSSNVDLGKICLTPEGLYDQSKAYEKLSLVTVVYADGIEAYVSMRDLPSGIAPVRGASNGNWQVIGQDFSFGDLGATITVDAAGYVLVNGVRSAYTIDLSGLTDDVAALIKDDVESECYCPCSRLNDYTMTLGTYTPAIAQVRVNGVARLSGERVTVKENSLVVLEAYAEGYEPFVRAFTVTGDFSTNVVMTRRAEVSSGGVASVFGVDITTVPSDATVVIDGETTNRKFVMAGDDVYATVSRKHYHDQTLVFDDIYENKRETVTLEKDYTLKLFPAANSMDGEDDERWQESVSIRYGQGGRGDALVQVLSLYGDDVADWAVEQSTVPSWVSIYRVTRTSFFYGVAANSSHTNRQCSIVISQAGGKSTSVQITQIADTYYYDNFSFRIMEYGTDIQTGTDSAGNAICTIFDPNSEGKYGGLGLSPEGGSITFTVQSFADKYNAETDELIQSKVAVPWHLADWRGVPSKIDLDPSYPQGEGNSTYVMSWDESPVVYDDNGHIMYPLTTSAQYSIYQPGSGKYCVLNFVYWLRYFGENSPRTGLDD